MKLDYEILKIGNNSLTTGMIIYVSLCLLITWLVLFLLKRIVYSNKKFDSGQKFTIYTISKYFIYFFSISFILNLLGIDITVFVAGSTALFVGIGLGLQGLFYDFISGIILLIDGTIKVGNIIEIKEKRVEILAIRFRTSVVKTRDEKEIIVPNSFFTKNEIINWSNQKNVNRHSIKLQVSDIEAEITMNLIKEIVATHPKVLKDKEPYVRIERFTDYAIEINVLFWSEEVYAVGRMLGEIRLLILQELKKNNIALPNPQQIITLKNNP